MNSLNKIVVLALLGLMANPAWSGRVDFCKVKKVYDEQDVSVPPRTVYEDCSGEAYLGSIGKDSVKAVCWVGATELLEGKCEASKDAERKENSAGDNGDEVQENEQSALSE